MSCRIAILFAALLAFRPTYGASPITTGTLEPGQAEARTTATQPVELPATWDHPKQEARSIWITAQELQEPKEKILQKLDGIAAANFNGVMLDTWFRGYVIYPGSAYVPQYPAAKEAGQDALSWVIDEAHKRKLRADAWPSYGYYAYYAKNIAADTSRGPLLTEHPELTAMDSNGKISLHNPSLGDFYSLCPANQKSHDLMAALYVETMQKYPFDGLNLDRMRFPASNFCYCPHCKERFKTDTGLELTSFAPGSAGAIRFLEWKREQNAKGVATIARAVRLLRPDGLITSYVVGPGEMDDKAQSWDLWVKQGSVDAVAVSMYGSDIRDTCRRALNLLDGRQDKLICAISCELPHPSFYLRNIGFSREVKALGQFTWYAGKIQDDLDALKSGPYAESAEFRVKNNPR